MLAKYILIILGLAVVLNGCSGFKRYDKIATEEYIYKAGDKNALKIDNISGSVRVVNSLDSTIRIKITKQISVKKKDLEKPFSEIKVNIDTNGNTLKIDADIFAKSGGLFSQVRNPFIDYEISVPSYMDLTIENTNGYVVVKNVNSNINIDIINGSIDFTGSAKNLNLGITNGDVTGKIDSVNSINIDCINSEIMLTVPGDFPGLFDVESVNGKIETDNLEIMMSEKDKNSFRGKNGTGAIPVKVRTVNGKIFLIGK